MFSHDIIVIGGGAAGLTVASGASQLGLKTALIDSGELGGDCLHFGCVPSKSLIRSADFYDSLKHTENLGLPKVKQPPIDLKSINSRVHNVIKKLEHHDSPERFRDLGCDVYLTSCYFLDPYTIKLDSGEKLSSKKIVLATGSSPMIPDFPGLKEITYLTNREIFSLDTLPESLITIGAGPIGIELSQALQKLGCKLTIITNTDSILPKEDRDMSAYVERELLDGGAEIIYNAQIKEFKGYTKESSVIFAVEGKEEKRTAEKIFLTTGRVGNVNNLGVEEIGLEIEHGYFKVDPYLRTNYKHIMAIGDCNGQYLFTHIAGAEGSNTIKRFVFGLKSKMDYSKTPWCTYCKPEIASIGYNELRAKDANIPYQVIETNIEDVDRAQAEGKTTGKIKILIDKKERIIGTQIVADSAGELILPSIMNIGKKLSTLLTPIYPYPILGELHKRVAGKHYSKKLFNSRNRKILKLLFRYRG